MIGMLKRGINTVADRLGHETGHKATRVPEPEMSHFESCLRVILGMKRNVNIVQIGANDGSINDPLYAFASNFSDRSHVILVEPQAYLIPYLEENYRFHDNKYITSETQSRED